MRNLTISETLKSFKSLENLKISFILTLKPYNVMLKICYLMTGILRGFE